MLLGLALWMAAPGFAAPAEPKQPREVLPVEEAARRGGVSLDEAIDRAQKRYRARVVRAEQSQSGGRIVYVLRMLSDDDGRVFTVRVDAATGAME